METFLTPKNAKKMECKLCEYSCSKQSEFDRHILTNKHAANVNAAESDKRHLTKNMYTCKECNKEYNSRNGLWKHNKTCIVIKKRDEETENKILTGNDLVEMLIKENADFKTLILDIMKNNTELLHSNTQLVNSNTELQKQMVEVCKSIQPSINGNNNITTNNTNSHNKTTFNMQVFLNEHCKDAMTLNEFMDSIKLTFADLEMVNEKGVIDGLSNVIIKSLRATDKFMRPIHCSDAKRDVMYVKDNDKWEKDGPRNDKVRNMVKNVEYKNIRQLTTYGEVYPDSMDPDSPLNDHYLELSSSATSATDEHVEKIIMRIAKEVVVDK